LQVAQLQLDLHLGLDGELDLNLRAGFGFRIDKNFPPPITCVYGCVDGFDGLDDDLDVLDVFVSVLGR